MYDGRFALGLSLMQFILYSGFLHEDSSGFQGQWDNNPLVLDNGFYRTLVDVAQQEPDARWEQRPAGNGQFVWRRRGRPNNNNIRRELQFPPPPPPGGGRPPQAGPPPPPGGGGPPPQGGGRDILMLNADMALVSDFDFVNSETGEVSCLPNNRPNANEAECPAASSLDQVLRYATNGDEWISDFRNVLTKMINHVDGVLIAVDEFNE
jgi:hypothetical protein